MSPSIIHVLPEELINHILCFVDTPPTLCALCLVSKDVNRIATAHLYSNIHLQQHDFRYLRPLAFLLWTSQKHRDAVRSVSVKRAYGGDLYPWPRGPELDNVIRTQIRRYVREGDAEGWFLRIRDGVDALPVASLLLRSLPNVASMQFDGFELVDPSVREGGSCRDGSSSRAKSRGTGERDWRLSS